MPVSGLRRRAGLLGAARVRGDGRGASTPIAHLALTSDHLDLAFHQPPLFERPMLVFRDADMPARLASLRERGVSFAATPRALTSAAALLQGPDGTPLLLLPAED